MTYSELFESNNRSDIFFQSKDNEIFRNFHVWLDLLPASDIAYIMSYIYCQEGGNELVWLKDSDGLMMLEGYTDNYIKVETPYRPEWSNQIIDWTLQ